MTDPAYRLLPWTLSAICIASIPHFLQMPLHLSGILFLLLLGRITLHIKFLRMPSTWIKVSAALVYFILVLANYKTINGATAGSALLLGMVCIKSYELNTIRDHAVSILAIFFIIVSYVLDDTSIWSALYMLFAASLSIITLIKTSAPDMPARLLMQHSRKLLLFALPLTVILFLLFPRIPGPLWGLPNSSQAKTGLSDSMRPGTFTDLIRSDELVLRARFINQDPQRKNLYWRGPVLHDFDGQEWTGKGPTIFSTNKNKDVATQELIEYEGVILELLPNATFRIKLDNDHEIIGYTSGKMRKNRIRVLVGDRVKVEMTPYDLTKGRITYRFK